MKCLMGKKFGDFYLFFLPEFPGVEFLFFNLKFQMLSFQLFWSFQEETERSPHIIVV